MGWRHQPDGGQALARNESGDEVDFLPHRRGTHSGGNWNRGKRRPHRSKGTVVRVKVGKRLKTPKTLPTIKAEKLFTGSPLLVIGRLSVVPLTKEQWDWFLG